MNITVLGSCANQISNREGVALLVEQGTDNLLIDCGPGIVAAFGRVNRKMADVTSLLLTHVHGDHISGFPYFVWNRNFERMGGTPAQDLHVYGEKETIEFARFAISHCYPELHFPFEVHFHVIQGGDAFTCGSLSVKTIDAIHTVPCLACSIEADDRKVAYSCDSLPNDELYPLAKNADLLIHEGMLLQNAEMMAKKVRHSLAKDAGEFAQKAHAKHLALVHIAPALLGQEGSLSSEAKTMFDGMVTIPYDGTVYSI